MKLLSKHKLIKNNFTYFYGSDNFRHHNFYKIFSLTRLHSNFTASVGSLVYGKCNTLAVINLITSRGHNCMIQKL